MPLYTYHCQKCDTDFDYITSISKMDSVECPDCGNKARRKVSNFNIRTGNKFTKDGEGFSSVKYPKEEYNYRVKNNLGKYDKP